MTKRATLKDVARMAGVSSATVSYVINNTPGQSVKSETRKRVMDAVAKLRYMPNEHARTLRSQSSPCVGVVIRKNLAVPRFSQVVYGIQRHLGEAGYNALLLSNASSRTPGVSDYVAAYLARRVEGVIFVGEDNEGPDEASLRAVRDERIPFVVYDCQRESTDYSTIDLDYRGGARLLVERVLERGPKHLLYVRPEMSNPQEQLREAGVREAIAVSGSCELTVRELPVTLQNLDVWDARYSLGDTEEGLALMETFLEAVVEVSRELRDGDAVVASWAGWTHYFRKVSPQLSFVSAELANNGESRIASDLYTFMPNYEVGAACADELLRLVEGKSPSARIIKLTNIVETTL